MQIDGEQLARQKQVELAKRVAQGGQPQPGLAIVYAGENSVSPRFIERKRRMGEEIGVIAHDVTFPHGVSQDELVARIKELAQDSTYHGIIVQLPLPQHIAVQETLNTVPLAKDVDVLSEESVRRFCQGVLPVMPPVVGAIDLTLRHHHIPLIGRHVVVVGQGRLVGRPVVTWLQEKDIEPTIIDKETPNAAELMREADILITGVGKPGFITPDCIKEGAVVLDAGTTTQAGELQGDVDPAAAEKCTLFTPVPGGLGPLTVAMVFENLVTLWERYR